MILIPRRHSPPTPGAGAIPTPVDALAAELEALGRRVHILGLDVSRLEGLEVESNKRLAALERRVGRLAIWLATIWLTLGAALVALIVS